MRVLEALRSAGIDTNSTKPQSFPFEGVLMSPKLQVDIVRDKITGEMFALKPFGEFNPELIPVDNEWVQTQQTLANGMC